MILVMQFAVKKHCQILDGQNEYNKGFAVFVIKAKLVGFSREGNTSANQK
jgi:hypothetical protein